jgi:NAD(P)-dependent dehydrogenase (short-subunit alcohol dehydrogenase family)
MKIKYLLITGASSGIGREMAIYLSQNYNLILHGRNLDRLNIVLEKCDPKNNHKIWQQDLNNIYEIEDSLIQFIKNELIEISGFVHCAGYLKMAPLKMSNAQVLSTTLNTNIISASLIVRTLTNIKYNSKILNSVVFISSNLSNRGAKAMSAYGSSKGALDMLMKCLAVELAPKVRVNSILPGAIQTEMTKSIFENKEIFERMKSVYPLGIGESIDVCYMAEFLLSDKAKWITGQQITIDGGRNINITD